MPGTSHMAKAQGMASSQADWNLQAGMLIMH